MGAYAEWKGIGKKNAEIWGPVLWEELALKSLNTRVGI